MLKRKEYLIDKKFQLKKSIILISSVLIIIAVIIICSGIVIGINNRQVEINNSKIMNNINNIKEDIETGQENLIKNLLKPDNKLYKNLDKNNANNLIKNYNNSIKTLNASIQSNETMMIMEANKKITVTNTWLFITIILVTIIGIAILFFQLIRQTHKISGPVYLMTHYANAILKGDYPEMRDLREKDDLKDFYVLFKQMAGRIIELEKKSKNKSKKR